MSDTSNDPAGVPADTVLETVENGETVREKVVNDTDQDGNVIGWHKESV